MRVIERARDAIEVGEQQIAVDEPVHTLGARALLELLERVPRAGQQRAPPSSPQDGNRRLRSVTLRAGGKKEGGVGVTTGGPPSVLVSQW